MDGLKPASALPEQAPRGEPLGPGNAHLSRAIVVQFARTAAATCIGKPIEEAKVKDREERKLCVRQTRK
jgi:hypothetical protein